MKNTAITVNGINAEVSIVEVYATRFGGHVEYKRPTYRAVVNHGKYADAVGNYASKALAEKDAVAAAEKFLAKTYPAVAVAAPVAAPVAAKPETAEDWFALLLA